MGDIAISVKNVSKSFRLPHERHTGLKQAIINFHPSRQYERQQVLKDVSFDIKRGEFFGIVGRNGSGKSTLLKLLAHIYSPDEGEIKVNDNLTPFIELGVGFNPELTGRENIFLNGALLGFDRNQIKDMYDDIVNFAELERFMDQKLKNYSSGMQVRLAFSIAIQAESDILVLDEVLAVGDEAFQRKCINVFEQYKASKKTIVLVTHDMSVVEKYCNRAVLIDQGRLLKEGTPHDVAHEYSRMNRNHFVESIEDRERSKSKRVSKWDFSYRVLDAAGKERIVFDYGEEVVIGMRWKDPAIKNIGVALLKRSGEYVFGVNTFRDKHRVSARHLEYHLKLTLGGGSYQFIFGLFSDEEKNPLEFIDNGPEIIVNLPQKPRWEGIARLDYKWR